MTKNKSWTPLAIKRLRARLGMTQAEFADVLKKVHPMTVSKWERGIRVPTKHFRALFNTLSDEVDK